MTKPSALVRWPGVLVVALLLPALGNGCSSSRKASSDGAAGSTGGSDTGGSGGKGSGGSGAGGSGGKGSGGSSTGGSGGAATGGAGGGSGVGGRGGGGSGSLDGGTACPPDGGVVPFLFCVDGELYESHTLCSDGGCACANSLVRHCDDGCASGRPPGAAACAVLDAGQSDTPTVPDASKLDGLTIDPPDGANVRPQCTPGKTNGFRREFCYGNGLFASALACPAGSSCTCVAMLRAYCANRCVELADESAECR